VARKLPVFSKAAAYVKPLNEVRRAVARKFPVLSEAAAHLKSLSERRRGDINSISHL